MWRFEVGSIVSEFVVFYNYETGDERIEAEVVEREVSNGALPLLLCCMRGLEDED